MVRYEMQRARRARPVRRNDNGRTGVQTGAGRVTQRSASNAVGGQAASSARHPMNESERERASVGVDSASLFLAIPAENAPALRQLRRRGQQVRVIRNRASSRNPARSPEQADGKPAPGDARPARVVEATRVLSETTRRSR